MEKYIGRLLDNRYEILEVIGVGGMAVVYKARDHRLNRLVAVKILKDEYSQDEEFRRRFNAESQAVAMLSNPNIVAVYDVSEFDGVNFIVMELIDGITLKQYLQRRGLLNWRETLHFSLQIAKALEHAHSRGIVHRDIKPHNIMILKDGSVKVADFGIARMTASQNTLTREALGSVHYISPEQAKGGKTDCRSDIYSLGVVMYEMITGKPPFDGDTPVAVAIQHINGKARMPSEINPEVPKGLEQIAMHAMTADIALRYSSASDMVNDLEEFRKNPAAVFDFGLPGAAAVVPDPVQNVAEKIGKTNSGKTVEKKNKPSMDDIYGEENDDKNRKAIIIVSIACGVLLVILGLLFFGIILPGLTKDNASVKVPDFIGKSATEIIPSQYSNFLLETKTEYDSEVPRGYVISQSPLPDTEVSKGTTISLVISLGEKTNKMQLLSGKTVQEAQDILAALNMGLSVSLEYMESDTFDKGTIINSDPVNGIRLEEGQKIILYVSTGSEKEDPIVLTTVPSVLGYSLSSASTMLENKDLKVGTVSERQDDAIPGTVIEQSIASGANVEAGTGINLTISSGRVYLSVPSIKGYSLSEAKRIITNAKLNVGSVTEQYSDAEVGTVINQSPPAGYTAAEGDYVEIILSAGVMPAEEIPEDTDPAERGEDPGEEQPSEEDNPPEEEKKPEETAPSEQETPAENTEPATEVITVSINNLPVSLTETVGSMHIVFKLDGATIEEGDYPFYLEDGTPFTSVPFTVEVTGTQVLDVYVDGILFTSRTLTAGQ